MNYVDIHTHRRGETDHIAVVNLAPGEDFCEFRHCSCGIHPWDVKDDWPQQMELLRVSCMDKRVVAIGECGLDKLRGGDWKQQVACFEAHVALARELGKPLLLHCVKAMDELLLMCRGVKSVWHGFRGGPNQAVQLLREGLDLSFGEHFNADSLLLAYEQRRLWLETDDSALSIEAVYERACKVLSISPTDLELPGTITFAAI